MWITVPYPVWYTFEVIDLIKKKSSAHAKWKQTKNQDDYSEFSRLRSAVKSKTWFHCVIIIFCISNLQLNITKNIKFFWAYPKSERKTNSYPTEFNSDGMISSEPQKICKMFSSFFQTTYIGQPLRADQRPTIDNMTTSSRPMTNIEFSVDSVAKCSRRLMTKRMAVQMVYLTSSWN